MMEDMAGSGDSDNMTVYVMMSYSHVNGTFKLQDVWIDLYKATEWMNRENESDPHFTYYITPKNLRAEGTR